MLTAEAKRSRRWLADLGGDVRQALRTVRSHQGLTATIVLTAALGIGSTSAVFSLVNAVLVRPLAYPFPDRLLLLMTTWRGRAPVPGLSAPEFFTWRRTTSVFEASAAYRIGGAMTLGRDGQLQQVNAARVSADFFALFGARAARGRTFTLEEDRPGGPALAVVSDEFWRLRMNAAADALGQRLSLDGQDYDVIGVLEPDFDADALGLSRSPRPDVWVPLQLDPASTSDAPLLAAARLREDASIDVARVQTEAAGAAIRRVLPQVMPEEAGLTVEPLHDVVVRDVRPALLLLLGAVALVLLIVCVNTAHLLLVRAASRQREMAIRLATGASRLRIVRQLLTESLLLSMAGGALGVYLAIGGLRALVAGYADALPPIVADSTGHADGWASARVRATHVHRRGRSVWTGAGAPVRARRSRSGAARRRRTIGIHLSPQDWRAVRRVRDGARADAADWFGAPCPQFHRPANGRSGIRRAGRPDDGDAARRPALCDRRRDVAHRRSVASTSRRRTRRRRRGRDAHRRTAVRRDELPQHDRSGRSLGGPYFNGGYLGGWQVVSPGYFDTLRIPLVAGRVFTDREDSATAPVVVINQRMARQFWPNESALGHYVLIGEGAGPEFEETTPRQIIGVVGDVRHVGLEWDARPTAYVPLAQIAANQFSVLARNGVRLTWVVRSRVELDRLAGSLQRGLQQASGGVAVARVRSMPDLSRASSASMEFSMALMVAFGLTALALAALGVFGVMAHTVR